MEVYISLSLFLYSSMPCFRLEFYNLPGDRSIVCAVNNEGCHLTIDSETLNGMNAKAKANSAQAIPELIQIATGKTISPDYHSKHKGKAMYGWYRYDTRFALPVYNKAEELERYNIFSVRMLVRHDLDGKRYLYDMLRIKKETSTPLEQ